MKNSCYFCLILTKIECLLTNFSKNSHYHFSCKTVWWKSSSIQADRHTWWWWWWWWWWSC